MVAEREHRLTIRVSKTEKAALYKRAKGMGFGTISAYVRFLIRNDMVIPEPQSTRIEE